MPPWGLVDGATLGALDGAALGAPEGAPLGAFARTSTR